MVKAVLVDALTRAEKKAKQFATQQYQPQPLLNLISRRKQVRLSSSSSLQECAIPDNWFSHDKLLCTSEEKGLVDSLREKLQNPSFLTKYSNPYLVRNEKDFSIYDAEGRAFQPDFVLLLSDTTPGHKKEIQLFIEPKGLHLVEHDQWKENALLELNVQVGQGDSTTHVLGAKFYQHVNSHQFWDSVEAQLNALP